jgi:cell wall-associated NlpC family hydrolase
MPLTRKKARQVAARVAYSLLNKPYLWGGDDPMGGFDCSGLCIEILKSVGLLPRQGDWTANQLYKRFLQYRVSLATQVQEGCLVFWGNGQRMTHVEYALDDELTIGASGGGSSTSTLAVAMRQNAYIKVRPWRDRVPPELLDAVYTGGDDSGPHMEPPPPPPEPPPPPPEPKLPQVAAVFPFEAISL